MQRTNPAIQVAIAQMRPVPGNVRHNVACACDYIADARAQGAKIVVLPELATSGYLLGDLWEHDSFIREITAGNETIREASQGLTVVWGSVRADWDRIGEDGRVRKYNAAMIAQNGEWVTNHVLRGWVPKTNLPKYRIFDDARHFYPAGKLLQEMKRFVDHLWQLLQPFDLMIDGQQVRVALTVCEDLWEDEYNEKPSRIYEMHNVDLLIDISQSPWTADKWHARDEMLKRRARDAKATILYVNSVGLQNNAKNLVWFDGNSCLIDKEGRFRWRAPQSEEGMHLLNLGDLPEPRTVRGHKTGIEEIHDVTIPAMREFFAPFPRVVTGLSGGIDSAVSLALMAEALGPKKLLAVNMPTEYNSQTTQDLARLCAANLDVEYRVVPIQALYEEHLRSLASAGHPEPSMLVKENIQARIRGSVLAMIAAAEGGVFTCNGNKTEVALNYFTLYGDGAGAAAFLADFWKGQVYDMARLISIPQEIIDVTPSAELSPEQNVDEGKGDPIFYPYHDQLMRMFIERRWDPTDVLKRLLAGTLESDLGCAPGTVAKYFPTNQALISNLEWAWSSYGPEYKRHQLPPVFITSRRAFGFDRRAAIMDGYLTNEYYRLRELCLTQAA